MPVRDPRRRYPLALVEGAGVSEGTYGISYNLRKRLVIYRGLPGSGKTTHATKRLEGTGGVLLESEQFWSESRPFVSWPEQPELWPEIMAWLRARLFRAMYHGTDLICLANVHTKPSSYEWVWELSDAFGYAVSVHKMHETPTQADLDLWLARGKDTMTDYDMERMARGWE